MREVAVENNDEAFRFAERLFAGEFDMVIFLTGVGARALQKVVATRHGEDAMPEALRRLAVVVRGPKAAAVMREWNIPVAVFAPEPNTWREVLAAIEGRPERRLAVQEYGVSNERLIAVLCARGADVTKVPVYRWDLPEDTEPLASAARLLAAGEIQVALFTTSIQVAHLLRVAADLGIEAETRLGLERGVIASIGPTTTEALEDFGFAADFAPSHPKMGFLVKETADRAPAMLEKKRS